MGCPYLYNAFLDSVDDPITAAHYREDLEVLDFRMWVDMDAGGTGSGSAWGVEVEVPNYGWATLAVGGSKYIAFIEQRPDGTYRTLAKGRVLPLEGEANTSTLRVRVVCAPADIQGKLFQFASTTLAAEPYSDRLFSDFTFEAPESYLEGRSECFTIHPVTHAISTTDICAGKRVVDLADGYDWNSLSVVSLAPPFARARLTVVADWEQHTRGAVNIAGLFGLGGISTLNPSAMETADRGFPGSLVNYSLGQGWTLGRSTLSATVSNSYLIFSGRILGASWSAVQSDQNPGPQDIFIDNHTELVSIMTYTYKPYEVWMEYDYQQPRRETATILVAIDTQDVIGVCAEKDLGQVSLTDLHQAYYPNPNPPPEPDAYGNYITPYSPFITVAPHDVQTVYQPGDQVDVEGYIFQAVQETSGLFWQYDPNAQWKYSMAGGYRLQSTGHENWVSVPSTAAIPDYKQPRFFDTDRGRQALVHAMLRCRAYLRKCLMAREVSMEFMWEDAAHVRVDDTVRVVLYAGPRPPLQAQPVVGTVKSIERKWTPSGRTVKLTLRVGLGTGRADAPNPLSQGSVYAEDYFADSYVEGDNTLGYYGFDDIQYTIAATPCYTPVDAYRLGDPLYSVLVPPLPENTAAVQLGLAQSYGAQGRDPRDAASDHPTYFEVVMRPLNSTGALERLVDVAATILVSPRGIDLESPGAEP